jgi:hypothetical protein
MFTRGRSANSKKTASSRFCWGVAQRSNASFFRGAANLREVLDMFSSASRSAFVEFGLRWGTCALVLGSSQCVCQTGSVRRWASI